MIYISFFLILLVVGSMAYWQFESKVHQEEANIQTQLDKTAFRLQNLTNSTTQYLYTARHQFNYYLKYTETTKTHPLTQHFRQGTHTSSGMDYFHTDSLPFEVAQNFGNLTGLGTWNDLSNTQKHEVSAILDVMTLFENAPKSIPDFAWTYVSSHLVLGIYPRILSSQMNIFDNQIIKSMVEGTPEHTILFSNNPKREVRWIQAYFDPAGKGVMVSALVPIYNQDVFLGHIGIDVRLNTMGNIIKKSQREYGKTFIINEYNQLIAHPELITKKDSTIKKAEIAFPEALKKLNSYELKTNKFYDFDGYKVYYNLIPNTKWKQVYVVSHSIFYRCILQELGMGFALFVVFLVILLVSVIYTRSHFITPAYKLIQYIQAEKENQLLTEIPHKLPKIWQPWFKIVAKIFAQNRLIIRQVSEQNENLEKLVNERTAQLQTKNSELETKQHEILSQNEELQQQQEEITSHRDQIEKNNTLLEKKNRRILRNQEVLAKAYQKMRATQKALQTQKNKFEEKNTQITSSIQYAKTIQTAVLPFDERMKSSFSEYFVMYRPKDIVAGDFYWLNKFRDKIIFAVADCTGHGVPGAFMSLIGYSLLSEIINENHILSPADILNMLHFSVRKNLKQNQNKNKDGMDIGILIIDKSDEETRNITFCGAKIPLYYTENQELKELKPTRKSIGGIQNKRKQFENQAIELKTGEVLYLGSDGYGDQHNIERQKFGQKNLFKLLEKIQTDSLENQKKHLEKALAQHQQDQLQRDDITLIGIKI